MNKSYYAIIPANVRYDSDLTANSKLLYGEITALCNEKGYCWATNSYFSELYGVSKVSISRWINQLCEKGYIRSDIKYKKGSKEIDHRYLTICNDPIKENDNTPINKKFKDNSTGINNTSNNKYNPADSLPFFNDPEFKEVWKDYLSVRAKKKAAKSDRAIKGVVTKLLDYSNGDKHKALQIVAKSADSGWSDIYQLKEEIKPKTTEDYVAESFRKLRAGELV